MFVNPADKAASIPISNNNIGVKKQVNGNTCKILLASGISILGITGCGVLDPNSQVIPENQSSNQLFYSSSSEGEKPMLYKSLDRLLVTERMYITNEPKNISWIYLQSNGKTTARFPVVGGAMIYDRSSTSNTESSYANVMDLPPELKSLQTTSNYVYWFSPDGQYQQYNGEYFTSSVPYEIDANTLMINTEKIDKKEEDKRSEYQTQAVKWLFESRIVEDFRRVIIEARDTAEEIVTLVDKVKALKARNTGDPENWNSSDKSKFDRVVKDVKEKEERYKYLTEWYNKNSSKYDKEMFLRRLLPIQLPSDYTTLEVY
ncbi:hypothetical protein [Brevibacillus reuszeri]|uniref:hypothetical protein n=1 Tax=Brevibacillus reuszeri TaxID=54915 RepID=UPI000CCC581E|nr:hypothetical protein [Brevibacillus reuszeri]